MQEYELRDFLGKFLRHQRLQEFSLAFEPFTRRGARRSKRGTAGVLAKDPASGTVLPGTRSVKDLFEKLHSLAPETREWFENKQHTPRLYDDVGVRINEDELLQVRAVDPEDEILMVSRAGLTVRFAESDARSMGRDTTGVRGMDVGDKGEVIAMDVARDDMDLLVVTENGFGKRTLVREYRKTNRGAKGVKTIALTEAKGGLAGALVVREHEDLIFISREGMVQRTAVEGINRYGRAAQGVKVMNIRDEDEVSAVAIAAEGSGDTAASVEGEEAAQPAGIPGHELEYVDVPVEDS